MATVHGAWEPEEWVGGGASSVSPEGGEQPSVLEPAHGQRARHPGDLRVETPFGTPDIGAKLELSRHGLALPAEVLEPVPQFIHGRYGFDLPALPVVRMEEAISEKLARYRRVSLARDLYDLAWFADAGALDAWEGADNGLYRKLRVRVATLDGDRLCWVYVLDGYEGGLPSARTIGILADAAEAADAPNDYVQAMRALPCRSTGH